MTIVVIFCFSCFPPLIKVPNSLCGDQDPYDVTLTTFHSVFHYLSFIHLLADQIEPINICQWPYTFRLMLGKVLLPSILFSVSTSTIPPFFKPPFKGYFNPLIDIISSLLLIPIKLCLPQSASHIPFYHYLCSLSSLSICKVPYLTCIFVC